MIKIGNTGIVGVYNGSTPITSICKGNDLAYTSGPVLSDEIIFEVDLNLPDAALTVYAPVAAIYSATGNESTTYFIVDWGDGTISLSKYTSLSVSKSTYLSHYYEEVGIYELKISINKDRQVDTPLFIITSNPAYGNGYTGDGLYAITKIKSWGSTPTSVLLLGDKVKNLTYVAPDTFGVITSNIPGARDVYRPKISTGSTTLSVDNFAPKLTGISPQIGYSPNLISLGLLFGHNDNITDFSSCITETANLETIDELYWAGATELTSPLIEESAAAKLHTIKSMYWGQISLSSSSHVFPSSNVIRHLTIKNLGENAISGAKQYDFSNLTLWGQNSEECPNARLSLVDSLITYSSTVSGGVNLYLPINAYYLLSKREKSQIRDKGYKLSGDILWIPDTNVTYGGTLTTFSTTGYEFKDEFIIQFNMPGTYTFKASFTSSDILEYQSGHYLRMYDLDSTTNMKVNIDLPKQNTTQDNILYVVPDDGKSHTIKVEWSHGTMASSNTIEVILYNL